jgi:hypothetical protein
MSKINLFYKAHSQSLLTTTNQKNVRDAASSTCFKKPFYHLLKPALGRNKALTILSRLLWSHPAICTRSRLAEALQNTIEQLPEP